MNLYKIAVQHSAPQDTIQAIACLLLARNDEEVYEWIKEGNIHLTYENVWKNKESDSEHFKAHIIALKGDMNDENYDYSDAHYGITLFGWELIEENPCFMDYCALEEAGILFETTALTGDGGIDIPCGGMLEDVLPFVKPCYNEFDETMFLSLKK